MSDTSAAEIVNGAVAAGHRTEAGKRRRNRDARTHGLTAASTVSDEERAALEETVRRDIEEIEPEEEHEHDLVRQAAAEAARRQRRVEAETEAPGRNVAQPITAMGGGAAARDPQAGFVKANEAPAPAAHPRRNEPPSEASDDPCGRPKLNDCRKMRDGSSSPSPGESRRTDPRPGALRGAPAGDFGGRSGASC